ncbi:MAG: hypothetical protein Fur009_0040 [Candidatus Microgenomates bacterium]
MRKNKFLAGEFFHVFNKSIANFGIFNDLKNSNRFYANICYYNQLTITDRFSFFIEKNTEYNPDIFLLNDKSIVKIIAYCIMPDHYHLLLKILKDNLLSVYISKIENSYTRYFNTKYKRKGPLWQSRFKAVRIKNNEQLLHVSRYIHLNPTTSFLVENPQDWQYSSYKRFINDKNFLKNQIYEISINDPLDYKKFVENNKDYQQKLKQIKKLILD